MAGQFGIWVGRRRGGLATDLDHDGLGGGIRGHGRRHRRGFLDIDKRAHERHQDHKDRGGDRGDQDASRSSSMVALLATRSIGGGTTRATAGDGNLSLNHRLLNNRLRRLNHRLLNNRLRLLNRRLLNNRLRLNRCDRSGLWWFLAEASSLTELEAGEPIGVISHRRPLSRRGLSRRGLSRRRPSRRLRHHHRSTRS